MNDDHTILFVDDENNILRALQRLFVDEPYRVLLANGGAEGLALLDQGERPTIIVSDQRMPGMGGVEFLTRASEISPASVRMVLTGYADINAAIDAVNLGGVSRYLMKPWNDDDLLLVVRDAVARFDLERKNRELTAMLAENNRLLEQWNLDLEQKVSERTKALEEAYNQNVQLTDELQKKLRELEARDRIQQHLLTIHTLEETLQAVVDAIVLALEADNAAIYLLDQDEGNLTLAADRQCTLIDCAGAHRQDEDEAMLRDAAAGRAYNINERLAGDGPERYFSRLFMPMRWGEVILGVILASRQGPAALDDEDLKAMESLAGLAAIAVHDSRMHGDLSCLGTSLDDVLRSL